MNNEEDLIEEITFLGNLTLTLRTKARETQRKEREEAEDTNAAMSIRRIEGHGNQSSLPDLNTSSSLGTPSAGVPNNSGKPSTMVATKPTTRAI